jgi:hypothetical protein
MNRAGGQIGDGGFGEVGYWAAADVRGSASPRPLFGP